MKIVQINSLPNGSTGKIAIQLNDMVNKKPNWNGLFFCGNWEKTSLREVHYWGLRFENKLSALLSMLSGFQNMFSVLGTLSLIYKLKRIKPDVIHIHNVHLWVINIPLLMKYIKKKHIKTVWTLHDCWSFTGHCPYFTLINCNKWKSGCYNCPQYMEYPKSFIDNSKYMWKLKKKWFSGVKNMTIVTPSEWLARLVKKSYLKDYTVRVINNGIDLDVFKPRDSDFRDKQGIPRNKYIILGVAFDWGKRKGLDVFVKLAKILDEKKYQIVLVGTDCNVDKILTENIISIHRTQNQQELAEIYSAADLFVNPSREDNFPTVNIESIACGTPVVTFRTGGSPEIIDETCGSVVDCDDVDTLENEIHRICETKPYSEKACLERAKTFDNRKRFEEYIKLYERI